MYRLIVNNNMKKYYCNAYLLTTHKETGKAEYEHKKLFLLDTYIDMKNMKGYKYVDKQYDSYNSRYVSRYAKKINDNQTMYVYLSNKPTIELQ